MAKIDIVSDVMRHEDHEIIEYLMEELFSIRAAYNQALKEKDSNYLYGVSSDVETVYRVLQAMNRRNKERSLQ